MTCRVAVIGGGITGLAAAHALVEAARAGAACDVVLFEAGERVGGAIRSIRRDGVLIEEGPDALITDKPWGLSLAEQLGLSQRLIGTQEEHRRSFVLHQGRLRPTPEGFHLLAPSRLWPMAGSGLFTPAGLARMAMEPFVPIRRGDADESVGAFVRRRFGSQALDRLAGPMVRAVYGFDPDDLSLRATLPRFAQMEKQKGSVLRALAARADARQASGARYGLFVSFDAGMQTLVDALAAALPPGCIRLGAHARLLGGKNKAWAVRASGNIEPFDGVVVATSAFHADWLLRDADDVASELASIEVGSASTVSLGFAADQIDHPMDGFGFVGSAGGPLAFLGCTFVHRKFAGRAPAGMALLRAFLGSHHPQISDAALTDQVLAILAPLLHIKGSPNLVHVARHRLATPRYGVGHLERAARITQALQKLPGLTLAGNYLDGVGLPDCIRSGQEAALRVIGQVAAVH